jgi:hypothetical protein
LIIFLNCPSCARIVQFSCALLSSKNSSQKLEPWSGVGVDRILLGVGVGRILLGVVVGRILLGVGVGRILAGVGEGGGR